MKNLTKLSVFCAAFLAVGSVQADTLNVGAVVAETCSLNLDQVSSGSVSSAEEDAQVVANLSLRCNTAAGATLEVTVLNGDLKSASSPYIINYTMELDVDVVNSLDIARTDTSPGATYFSSTAAFSPALANEVSAVFSLDVNVEAPGPFAEGQVLFPARAAPAGLYSESFNFTLSSL